MGQKKQKGTVSIHNADGRIRLRWSYQGKRYSISLSSYNKINLLPARKIALSIEQDMAMECFDFTLEKYSGKSKTPTVEKKTFTELFEEWTKSYKHMDCEIHTNYNSTRNMIKKWEGVNQNTILKKLNEETFCTATYNRRLTILKDFSKWLVKQSIWTANPLEDVNNKKVIKLQKPKRIPFKENEIKAILEAFKNDTYSSYASRYSHSHYYPFIYFIFKTGVRNAEAIGLRVGCLDFENNHIIIKEVLARSLKGSSAQNRIRKETKNGKVRTLPLTDDLKCILKPLVDGRQPDDLVFLSPKGLAIDDNNFQKRVFKVVLNKLGIEERVIYACRHTFGSRCIDNGITPVMTAFLMGNNPETALKNYTHQLTIPKDLPGI